MRLGRRQIGSRVFLSGQRMPPAARKHPCAGLPRAGEGRRDPRSPAGRVCLPRPPCRPPVCLLNSPREEPLGSRIASKATASRQKREVPAWLPQRPTIRHGLPQRQGRYGGAPFSAVFPHSPRRKRQTRGLVSAIRADARIPGPGQAAMDVRQGRSRACGHTPAWCARTSGAVPWICPPIPALLGVHPHARGRSAMAAPGEPAGKGTPARQGSFRP